MKRLFYQIKYSSFCRKIDSEIKILEKIEKNAIKQADETRRISYRNYLKQKEKGLLTKEYIEQEYKNLEDIIFERIQISNIRRTEILKNLKDEHFKSLKINPLIIEDLRRYRDSSDSSPFKAKSNVIDNSNITEDGRNTKISDFLNENFSSKKSSLENNLNKQYDLNSNHQRNSSNGNIHNENKIDNKLKKKEIIKLDRSKLIGDKRIYNVLRVDENEQIIEEKFSKNDKSNIKGFDAEGRDKAFIEFFGNKLNKEFAEAQSKVEQIKKKNIKKDIENKIKSQNANIAEGGMLTNPNKLVKLNMSRKTKSKASFSDDLKEIENFDNKADPEDNTEDNKSNIENLEESSLNKNYNSNLKKDENEIDESKQQEFNEDKLNIKDNINTNNRDKKKVNYETISEESLIEKYLREFGYDEDNIQTKNNNNLHSTDQLKHQIIKENKKSNDTQHSKTDKKEEILEEELKLPTDKKEFIEKESIIQNTTIRCKESANKIDNEHRRFKLFEINENSKDNSLESIHLNEYEEDFQSSFSSKKEYLATGLEEEESDFYLSDSNKNSNTTNSKIILKSKSNLVYDPQVDYSNKNKSNNENKSQNENKITTNKKEEKLNNLKALGEINKINKTDIPKNQNQLAKGSQKAKNEIAEVEQEEPDFASNSRITQINLREINLQENYLVKPTAKTLPYLKKETIYNHDQLQIITSLKTIEFKIKNVPKLIDMLSIIRRKKKFKTFDLPEISNAINFISNYISAENNTIPASYIVNFLYTLSDMQKFDEQNPSLSNELLVYEILDKLVPKLNTLDNRALANMLFALQKYQIRSPKLFNFADFLDKIEELIVKKFTSQAYSPICITQAVTAYSKCQAGSEEFYRIFADLIYAKKKDLAPKEISIILYSYSNNINCNEKLLVSLQDDVLSQISQFNSIELCNITRAYDKKKILDDKLKRKIIDAFVEKHENVKMLDLSYLYKILADENEKKFLKYSHSLINSLAHDVDGISLSNFISKAELISKIDKNLLSLLKKITIKLIDKKEIKGFELKKIYESVKDLPFDGKYNTFVENIVKQLEKTKYY